MNKIVTIALASTAGVVAGSAVTLLILKKEIDDCKKMIEEYEYLNQELQEALDGAERDAEYWWEESRDYREILENDFDWRPIKEDDLKYPEEFSFDKVTQNSEDLKKDALNGFKSSVNDLNEEVSVAENPKVNVFDIADTSTTEEIDVDRQAKFESGKNHILDSESDYWDKNGDAADFFMESGMISHDDFMKDNICDVKTYSYYRNDNTLIDDETGKISNDVFDNSIGWDWLDDFDGDYSSTDLGVAYVRDADLRVIYEIDIIDDSYFTAFDEDDGSWKPGAKDK